LGDAEDAIRDVNMAIQLYSTGGKPEQYAFAYTLRGLLKSSVSDKDAIKDFDMAIKLSPFSASMAYFYRGRVKIYFGDMSEGCLDLKMARELGSSEAYEVMEKYCQDLPKLDQSAESFTEQGTVAFDLGNIQLAMQHLNKAIRVDSNFKRAYFLRSGAKSALGDFEGAIQDINKVLQLSPVDESPKMYFLAFFSRGIAKAELGDAKEAILDYDRAIKIDSTDARVYQKRGISNVTLGRKSDACLDFKKAKELGDAEVSDFIERFCQ